MVEEVSVEVAQDDVPVKAGERRGLWLTTAAAKRLALCQLGGD